MSLVAYILNTVIKYAGLLSIVTLLIQTFANRARFKITENSANRYIGGKNEVDSCGYILTVPNPDTDVLNICFFLNNFGKWPCCIYTWELRIGNEVFINFDNYPKDTRLPTAQDSFTHLRSDGVFTPINQIKNYISPFESVKASVTFLIPHNSLNYKSGRLIIRYSTYSFLINRPKKAVLRFKIPPSATYIK